MAPLVRGEIQRSRHFPSLREAGTGTRGPGPHRSGLCKKGLGQGQVGWAYSYMVSSNSSPRYKDQHLSRVALSSGNSCDGGMLHICAAQHVAAHHVWLRSM